MLLPDDCACWNEGSESEIHFKAAGFRFRAWCSHARNGHLKVYKCPRPFSLRHTLVSCEFSWTFHKHPAFIE